MIINKKYGFLFVHIQKTGGISVTECLNKLPETEFILHQHSMYNSHKSEYSEYFKFCFVRNPWDRLVSWWNMMKNKGIHNDFSKYLLEAKNFSEFLEKTEIINETLDGSIKDLVYPKSISFNQLDYISDSEGKVLVDFIGRFENINEDFLKISEKIGFDLKLSHLNKFDHPDYRKYYGDKDIEKVYCMYKRDIDFFGYKF
jgi:chondroitin 4-sulfotransferase 11